MTRSLPGAIVLSCLVLGVLSFRVSLEAILQQEEQQRQSKSEAAVQSTIQHYEEQLKDIGGLHRSPSHEAGELKSVSEASMEEVEEILKLALEKFKEPHNIAIFEQAAVAIKLHTIDGILSSILNAKGFKEVGVMEFIRDTHIVIDKSQTSQKLIEELLDITKFFTSEADTDLASKVQLKSVSEASTEEVEEILSLALEKFKEPHNLAKFKQAAIDIKEECQNPNGPAAQLIVHPIINGILSPILTGKGFKETNVVDFMHYTKDAQEKNPTGQKFVEEISKIPTMDTSGFEADTAPNVREASTEEVEEIWSLAFEKFKEPHNLARLQEAAKAKKEATPEDLRRFSGPAYLEDLLRFLDGIISSILTGKGFKEMGITRFMSNTRAVQKASPKCPKYVQDLLKIMKGDTSALEKEAGPASEDDAHRTSAVAKSVLQITEEVTDKKVTKTAAEGKNTSRTGPAVVNKPVTEPSLLDAVSPFDLELLMWSN